VVLSRKHQNWVKSAVVKTERRICSNKCSDSSDLHSQRPLRQQNCLAVRIKYSAIKAVESEKFGKLSGLKKDTVYQMEDYRLEIQNKSSKRRSHDIKKRSILKKISQSFLLKETSSSRRICLCIGPDLIF
jgi:hypothetical protein